MVPIPGEGRRAQQTPGPVQRSADQDPTDAETARRAEAKCGQEDGGQWRPGGGGAGRQIGTEHRQIDGAAGIRAIRPYI